MQLSGFFLVEFSALNSGPGGIVAIDAGKFRGWDGPYLFAGDVTFVGREATVTMRVKPLSVNAESVFGTVGYAFDLVLKGRARSDSFTLTGPSPLPGGHPITVKGVKIEELDLL